MYILKTLLLIALLSLFPSQMLQAEQLPELGNHDRTSLSVAEELLIGEMWLQKLRAADLICTEPIINHYIDYLGQNLDSHADHKNFNF